MSQAQIPPPPGPVLADTIVHTQDGRRVGWRLPDDPSALRDLRIALRRVLADWPADPVDLEIIALAVIELTCQCLREGAGACEVYLSREDASPAGEREGRERGVLVMVSSDGPARSVPVMAGTTPADRSAGEGLGLVRVYARDWGRRDSGTGVSYWARLALPPQAA
ncbi:ATP-binding protein [Kitasatospora sp. NPDC101176]|uniref:ATP-binding protein n=1 Tax=Kitasatospora sp. NPDC101176 TaxID=3364099 RepID=UPI0037F8CD76